jgi:hypothetical protein
MEEVHTKGKHFSLWITWHSKCMNKKTIGLKCHDLVNPKKKGQPCAWSSCFARVQGKGRTTWGLYTQPFPANFCKRLFPRLEPVTSWSQGGSFYHCAKAPLRLLESYKRKNTHMNLQHSSSDAAYEFCVNFKRKSMNGTKKHLMRSSLLLEILWNWVWVCNPE